MMRSTFSAFPSPLSTAAFCMAVATLCLTMPTLAAASPCTQSNLLDSWETQDPASFATIRAQADATPNGKNIFWKIEKDGNETSYLLGTVHVSDPRVVTLPKAVQSAYDGAKTIVLELSEVTDSAKMTAAMMKRPDLMLAQKGSSIQNFIGDDNIAALDDALKARGLATDTVAGMNPVIVYTFVAMPACEFLRQAKGETFLDKQIGLDALKDDKKLVGLETPVEQLEALASLPQDFIKQSLISAVTLGPKLDELTASTVELYLRQDIGAIMPLMDAATTRFTQSDSDDSLNYAQFEEILINKRNAVMADRAAQYLDGGPSLIAVGVLHLPGEKGLVELLRAKGYTLTSVAL